MFSLNEGPNDENSGITKDNKALYSYAEKSSINTGLALPTIPVSIQQVSQNTLDEFGSEIAFMATPHAQAVMMNFFVGLLNARSILEIGTFTGLSAIYLAHALKRNGVEPGPDDLGFMPLTCLDMSEVFTSHAKNNLDIAGLSDYVDIIVGDARHEILNLKGRKFDFIYIDADKNSYKKYYDSILELGLLSKNGLIVVDNTALWKAVEFIDQPIDDAETAVFEKIPSEDLTRKQLGRVAHDFNEYIRSDPRTEVVMFPLFTGVTFIRVL
ncbi:hypothetical protein IW150_003040 [Coemansia sp. RSA 2607]|nr:hypothetical protein IW150_003040 [Coemansia sp. RSA 2607]